MPAAPTAAPPGTELVGTAEEESVLPMASTAAPPWVPVTVLAGVDMVEVIESADVVGCAADDPVPATHRISPILRLLHDGLAMAGFRA